MIKVIYVLMVGFFTFGFMPQILAQENLDEPVEQQVQLLESNETEQNADIENTRGNGNGAEQRAERLEAYKARVEARLEFAEERRIRAACKGAQTVSLRLTENVARIKQTRENTYRSVTDRLSTLIEKLEVAGVNGTPLQNAVETMSAEAEIFIATIGDYETVLTDLSELNCEEDPAAFKAALEVAKQQRVLLVSSSQSLRQYFNDSIKPILIDLRQTLTNEREGDE